MLFKFFVNMIIIFCIVENKYSIFTIIFYNQYILDTFMIEKCNHETFNIRI